MLKKFKKETLAQEVSCEFWEISKNTFFTEHLFNRTPPVAASRLQQLLAKLLFLYPL